MFDHHREVVRIDGKDTARLSKLSLTENSVLAQLADGSSAAQIAEETFTSIHTVRAHIRSILTKLDVSSQGAATAISRRHPPPRNSISVRAWRQMRRAFK
nr:helix-turn-helix transcriptional regulator [Spelaeicoccus albus]